MHGANPVPGTVSYVDETVTFTPVSDYPQNATLTATVTTAPSTRAATGGKALPKPVASVSKPVAIDPTKFSRQ